jgi:hypothetical protein
MSCSTVPGNLGGNDSFFIPLLVGEPLSTACERANLIGSVPVILRWANFTTVNGAVATSKLPSAGIMNKASFFSTRGGCYQNPNGNIGVSTCA